MVLRQDQGLKEKLTGGAGRSRSAVALTNRFLETLHPEAAPFRVPDLRSPGLAVRVAPSGAKTWDCVFRIRGTGKVKRLSLGPFPAVCLDDARTRAADLTKAAKVGRDLVAEKAAVKAQADARTSVAKLIDLYIKRAVKGRLRTAHEIELRLKRSLSSLMQRHADEIRRREIRAILDAVADRGAAREAEKQRQVIGTMFRWALGQDFVESDPTAGLAAYSAGERRDRVLAPDEIRTLWSWLGASGIPNDYADAMRLQLALGARIGEVAGIHVQEIDQKNWLWTLPAERSKNRRPRVTPLVGIAREILTSRLNIAKRGPLFITEKGLALTSEHVSSMLVKRRPKNPLSHFTTHDLRRTVATMLVEIGIGFELVAAVIGHESGNKEVRTLIRHYIRSDLIERKRTTLISWNNLLLSIIAGKLPTLYVVE